MKQKFNLGDTVWAFKQQGKELKKAYGVVQSAEIDASGFVFYKKCSNFVVGFRTELI